MQFNKTNKTVSDRAQITDVRMENDPLEYENKFKIDSNFPDSGVWIKKL